jgi:hypothetical protein
MSRLSSREGFARVTREFIGLQLTERKSEKMVEAGGVGILMLIENT